MHRARNSTAKVIAREYRGALASPNCVPCQRARFMLRPAPAVLALIIVSFAAAISSPAQEDLMSEEEWRRGYHGFTVICQSLGFEIESDFLAWQALPPERTLLVILGDNSNHPVNLRRYVSDGGAVLIASDRGNQNTRQLGVAFNAGPIQVVQNQFAFAGMRDCPIVTDIANQHPVTQNVRQLVTNRPGFLSPQGEFPRGSDSVELLANFPEVDRDNVPSRVRPPRRPAFIVGYNTSRGSRALFVSDHSLFANQMLMLGDNALFSKQAVEWLRGFDDSLETRDTVMIISDQTVVQPLDPSEIDVLLPPPNPADVIRALQNLPPEVLLEFSDAVIAAVEEEGVMNDLIQAEQEKISERQWRRLFLIVFAVLIGLYLLWRLLFGTTNNDRLRNAAGPLGHAFEGDSPDGAYERFLAAHELLRDFQFTVSERLGTVSESTLNSFYIANDANATRQFRRQLRQLARDLRRFDGAKWTDRQLARVESQIGQWRTWYDGGLLQGQAIAQQ